MSEGMGGLPDDISFSELLAGDVFAESYGIVLIVTEGPPFIKKVV